MKKYYLVCNGSFFLIRDDSINRVAENNFVRCSDISYCRGFRCNECPVIQKPKKRINLDDPNVKFEYIEY